MFILLARLALFALMLGVAYWLWLKWEKIDMEAKIKEIKDIEEAHKNIEEIEKHYPDYKKKKDKVEKFLSR